MFRDLVEYKKKDFFEKNKEIYLDLHSQKEQYEIFSVLLTTGDSGYIDVDFSSPEEFLDYITMLKETSLFYRDIDFKGQEEIITLSTCSYEFDNARTVIFGVKK